MNTSLWATVGASAVVVCIVLGATFLVIIPPYQSANANLQTENTNLNKQVSNLQQQVAVLQQQTATTVVETRTVVDVQTTTSVSTVTRVTTSSVYPIPDNVSVLITAGYLYSYSITAGSLSFSGSGGGSFNHNQTKSIPITPVFQGETISITVNLNSPTFACNGNVWVQLFVSGRVVANGSQYCGDGQGIQINYVL